MTMEETVSQESLFYITAGLCTLVAILVSYQWLRRQPQKESKDEGKRKEKSETTGSVKEEEQKAPAGCPFGFGPTPTDDDPTNQDPNSQNLDDLDDLLIDSSDIKPLNEEDKHKVLEEGGEPNVLERMQVKELEKEVVKTMSEQQLEDEQKARQAQLEAIFNLMQDNNERFGMSSVDDVQNQYKLYV